MNKIVATENKVFKNILTGDILGDVIYLAKSDSPSNYEEVYIPEENENTEQTI